MDWETALRTYIEAANTHAAATVQGDDAKIINRAYDRIAQSVAVLMQSKGGKAAHESELLLASEILHPRTRPLLSLLATILEHTEPV